jgi:peptidoglycan/xylan/chitin deacetylase (PgdA/CDA1 family)
VAVWPIISGGAAVLAGTASWAACHPRSQLFGPTLSRLRSESILALTFDDGPNPSATAAILDALERHRASATFFLIGGFARACPSLVKGIAERGHSIGNHTDSHRNTLWLSPRQLLTELVSCQDVIDEITGKRPLLMRPPFGFRGPHLYAAVKRSGLKRVVMWNLMGRDWTERGKRALIDRLECARGGDIVVLHDGDHRALGADRSETLRALEHWLPRWRDAGLQCVALDDRTESSMIE